MADQALKGDNLIPEEEVECQQHKVAAVVIHVDICLVRKYFSPGCLPSLARRGKKRKSRGLVQYATMTFTLLLWPIYNLRVLSEMVLFQVCWPPTETTRGG